MRSMTFVQSLHTWSCFAWDDS